MARSKILSHNRICSVREGMVQQLHKLKILFLVSIVKHDINEEP